ncbi:carboxypeptidase-like regulatory domain-containing protein [Pedobacter faecalis]|uniref:carboxypeptidase-like regulatory domain-containing protein n=1 Tax=Pedobacter faecalis TaxID=3041495 RepID=UPI00254BD9AC|nr:carboxypeptidase regulatory-like domain-containing protein [Pedobacter sp. ELA7]
MKRSQIRFILCLSLSTLLSLSAVQWSVLDKAVSVLQRWSDSHPLEKVYLHTDKPYYLVGDTIWFKAYVTVGARHRLSDLSGAVYVDLIDEADSVAQSLKLPVTSGMAIGDFVLHDSAAREGNYRLRAYTQWMRNAGSDYFYDQTFSVGNSVANTVFSGISYRYQQDGGGTQTYAVLRFTDQDGKPFSGKKLDYHLKESYKTIFSGSTKTDEAGEVSVNLSRLKAPDDMHSRYFVASMEVSKNLVVRKTFPVHQSAAATDIQFFPEGGHMVEGLRSRIAFKATAANGLGVAVAGKILDSKGVEVASFDTQHLGMGYFGLQPEPGNVYTAKIGHKDGSVQTIDLPKAQKSGHVLEVGLPEQNTESLLVRVHSDAEAVRRSARLGLLAQFGGTVQARSEFQISKAITEVKIPLAGVPTGVLQLTLFTEQGLPVNERVVFVRAKDQLVLDITSGKDTFMPGERIDLGLSASDQLGSPVSGNFSVSVVNDDIVPFDPNKERSIFSQLLLSADIRGYIEQPNYYFTDLTADKDKHLDLLMMTQGYRRFAWKDLLGGEPFVAKYQPEKLLIDITGRVTDLKNKPVPNAKIQMLSNKAGVVLDTVADNNGEYRFGNLLVLHGVSFSFQARTAGNSDRVMIHIDRVLPEPVLRNPNAADVNKDIRPLTKTTLEASLRQDMEQERLGKLSRVQQLREVQIRASTRWNKAYGINESQADEVYRPDPRRPCKTLMECLEEMDASRVRFRLVEDSVENCGKVWMPFYQNDAYFVMIDNMAVSACDYQTFLTSEHPDDIDRVYLSHESPTISSRLGSMAGALGQRYVMAIWTKQKSFRKKYNPSIAHYSPKGFDNAKLFYVPKNPVTDSDAFRKDVATTYWNPSLSVGSGRNGQFSFYAAPRPGNYRVTVEGIDTEGRLGRHIQRVKVR